MASYKYLGFLYTYQQEYGVDKEGCTNEEVDGVEQDWGVKFPLAYRELFLISGYYGGFGFHEGNEYTIAEYDTMRADAREVVAPEYDYLFEDKNVFIFSFNGAFSAFWFFLLDEGDDPPIYRYERPDGFFKIKDHLSDLIKAQDWYKYYLQQTGRQ